MRGSNLILLPGLEVKELYEIHENFVGGRARMRLSMPGAVMIRLLPAAGAASSRERPPRYQPLRNTFMLYNFSGGKQ